MKKYINQILWCILVLMGLSLSTELKAFVVDGINYETISETTVMVQNNQNNQNFVDVTIPETVQFNGKIYTVTTIGGYAFYNCSNLTTLRLPKTITEFQGEPFAYSPIKKVYVVDLAAFLKISYRNANSIDSYNPPLMAKEGITLYVNEQPVTNLVIPDGTTVLTTILSGYQKLESVTLPNTPITINNNAFEGCSNLKIFNTDNLQGYLKNITWESVIPGKLYINNQIVEDLIIPEEITEIKPYAFSGCTSLKSVKFHNKITSVGEDAFAMGTEDFVLGNPQRPQQHETVTKELHTIKKVYIDDLAAFCKIDFATSWKHGSNPLNQGGKLFINSQETNVIQIPEAIEHIKPETFYGLDANQIIANHNIKSIGDYAFSGKYFVTLESSNPPTIFYEPGLVKYIVPNEAYAAFQADSAWNARIDKLYPQNCALSTVEVVANNNHSSLSKAIGEENLQNILSLKIKGSINSYDIIVLRNKMIRLKELDLSEASFVANNYPYIENYGSKDSIVTAKCFDGLHLSKITLPQNIVSIDDYAFSNNSDLNSIEIPENVQFVRRYAFSNCTGLEKVILRTNGGLGDGCFQHCVNLENIEFPKNMRYFGNNCFEGCRSILTLRLPQKMGNIGYACFKNCKILESIYLPDNMGNLGLDHGGRNIGVFKDCLNLQNVEFPKEMNFIGANAFDGCPKIRKIILPKKINFIAQHAFQNCQMDTVIFPAQIKYIADGAFSYCKNLKEIKLPTSIKSICANAFNGCSSLKQIHIPSSIETIGDYAFYGCSNVKDVFTYTVEPTKIQQETFSCYHTATLHIPHVSHENYFLDTQWSQFLELVDFDQPYEYFYINGDYILDEETGRVPGTPDVDMNENSGLIVDGTEQQNTDSLNIEHDGENGGSIIADDNLNANKLNINIKVRANRWYFFCFPFDIPKTNIKCKNTTDYVFRYYDEEHRAQFGSGSWKDFTGDTFQMGKGYIFQSAVDDTLNISFKNIHFGKLGEKVKELVEHISKNLQDASWNFTGNPFLSYYNIKDMGYSSPITVWDGANYRAINPLDDDYELAPFEAFFVQKPTENPRLTFDGLKSKTFHQSQNIMHAAQAKRSRMKTNPSRLLTNLAIADDTICDQTRIVLNDKRQMNYELECDAAKFHSDDCNAQIYSIDNDQVHYAINERPNAEGAITIGYSVKKSGKYTLSAPRMDVPMYLHDNVSDVTFDLRLGSYTFMSEAGTFNNRFSLKKNNEATSIEELLDKTGVEMTINNNTLTVKNSQNATIVVYNLAGQQMSNQQGDCTLPLSTGNYIVKVGGLAVKVNMK